MKISVAGAVAGAILGAVGRAAVVFFTLDSPPMIFMLPSAAIGVLVGIMAGGLGRPLLGAAVGALLSAIIFELFLLPCASMLGTVGQIVGKDGWSQGFLREAFPYFLQMGLAGAIAGGLGGGMGRLMDWRKLNEEKEQEKSNAIEDALRPFNARVTDQYLPPTKILELAGVIAPD